jgi:hypothetical protein
MEKTFLFTSFSWHEIMQKVFFFDTAEAILQSNISVLNYSETLKVKRILFAHLTNPDSYSSIFDYKDRFSRKKGDIYLFGKIPYETFAAADEKTAMMLLCQTFLNALLRIPTLAGMKNIDFDAQKLHDDVEKLFSENSFL